MVGCSRAFSRADINRNSLFVYLLPLFGVDAFSAATFAVLARRASFCFLWRWKRDLSPFLLDMCAPQIKFENECQSEHPYRRWRFSEYTFYPFQQHSRPGCRSCWVKL